MSMEDVRLELANAAAGAAGVTAAHPYFTGDTAAGTVFVRLERIEYPNPFGGVAFWNVVLILPQDPGDTERFLADYLPELKAALDPHLVITSVRPERIDLPGVGVLPCAFFNGHREED